MTLYQVSYTIEGTLRQSPVFPHTQVIDTSDSDYFNPSFYIPSGATVSIVVPPFVYGMWQNKTSRYVFEVTPDSGTLLRIIKTNPENWQRVDVTPVESE